MNNNNTASFIKMLLKEGYKRRQIQIITGWTTSSIQRIAAGKTYQNISAATYQHDDYLDAAKSLIDKILLLREPSGAGALTRSDGAYIRLLRHCGLDYNDIRKIYYDRGVKELRDFWNNFNSFNWSEFEPHRIGLLENEYDFLINS